MPRLRGAAKTYVVFHSCAIWNQNSRSHRRVRQDSLVAGLLAGTLGRDSLPLEKKAVAINASTNIAGEVECLRVSHALK